LLHHNRPRNIRELENANHHALLVCRNQLIQPADLHLVNMSNGALRQHAAPADRNATLETVLNQLFDQNIPDLYDHIEEIVFNTAYRYCHGNQLQTSRLLGISRNIVRARLEKIGVLPPLNRKGDAPYYGQDILP
jgi:sigma-54-specific transcriptional regulator